MASSGLAHTANGAVTNASSLDACVDLFFLAGASRGKDITAPFALAYKQDKEVTGRMLLWLRDVLEGSGEREQFRKLFQYLIYNDLETARRILRKIPDKGIGRWDDVLVAFGTPLQDEAVKMILEALEAGDALCAKWMPRRRKGKNTKNDMVSILAKAMNPDLRPYNAQEKKYRKVLSSLSTTVEQQMCAREWTKINYNHVPSKAAQVHRKAFARNDSTRYQEYLDSLVKQDGTAKVNAKATFPHDVMLMALDSSYRGEPRSWSVTRDKNSLVLAEAQWKALPDFIGDSSEKILPMVDVSASMMTSISGSTAKIMEIAVALGMYIADHNKGQFAGEVITFTNSPSYFKFPGGLEANLKALKGIPVGYNTNFIAAFDLILNTAIRNNLSQEDLPTKILALSDMEFDNCGSSTNFETIKRKFEQAGYKMPQMVFWNLNGRVGNSPVTVRDSNTALVSGFSPSILTAIMKGAEDLSPRNVMMDKLLVDRYNF